MFNFRSAHTMTYVIITKKKRKQNILCINLYGYTVGGRCDVKGRAIFK